tara:strand:- start:1239 stop:1484 length:246 start_codon:yes stop_codon:yes gene_type:complete
MAQCKFCLTDTVDSWWGQWCVKCHRLQKLIALFGGEKVSEILETVLIVDKETQKEKIAGELKSELTTREYNLRARKEADSK